MAQDVARTEEKPAVHPVDQVLPVPKLAIYGFQHVLAFYAGAVIVPILLATAIDLTPEQLGVSDQRRPVHLRDRLDHPDHRVLEDRGPTAAPAGRDLRRGLADDQHRARRGWWSPRATGDLRCRHHRRNRHLPGRSVLRQPHPAVPAGRHRHGHHDHRCGPALGGGPGRRRRRCQPGRRTFGDLDNLALAGFTLVFILALYRFFRGFVATIAVLIGLVVGTAVGAIFGFTDFSRVGETPTCSA